MPEAMTTCAEQSPESHHPSIFLQQSVAKLLSVLVKKLSKMSYTAANKKFMSKAAAQRMTTSPLRSDVDGGPATLFRGERTMSNSFRRSHSAVHESTPRMKLVKRDILSDLGAELGPGG